MAKPLAKTNGGRGRTKMHLDLPPKELLCNSLDLNILPKKQGKIQKTKTKTNKKNLPCFLWGIWCSKFQARGSISIIPYLDSSDQLICVSKMTYSDFEVSGAVRITSMSFWAPIRQSNAKSALPITCTEASGSCTVPLPIPSPCLSSGSPRTSREDEMQL